MANDRAIGLIETRGVVALTAGIEAMLKSADVQCTAIERVASGYFAVAVQGSLAAVRQAVEAGKTAVRAHGELRSAEVFAKPHEQALDHLDGSFGARSGNTGKT